MEYVNVKIKFLNGRMRGEVDLMPEIKSESAAGADIKTAKAFYFAPGEQRLVSTGFAIALNKGWEAQIRPRSGLAAKHGITVVNSPGTIDSDYRGEVKVILKNGGEKTVSFQVGDRIAQMVVKRSPIIQFDDVGDEELDSTERASGGFGSTGVK